MRAADQRVPGDFRHPGDPGDRALELFIWEGVGFHRGGTQIRHSAVYPDQRIRHSGGDPAGGAGGLFDSGVPGQAGPAQGEKHDAIGGELAGGDPFGGVRSGGYDGTGAGHPEVIPCAGWCESSGGNHCVGDYDTAIHHQGYCHGAGGGARGI